MKKNYFDQKSGRKKLRKVSTIEALLTSLPHLQKQGLPTAKPGSFVV